MDILLGISIGIVYFMIGFLIAAIFEPYDFFDIFLAALFWPIILVLYILLNLFTFSFSLGEKLGDKLDKQLDKLIFWEKKQ